MGAFKRLSGYVGCAFEPVVGEANFWPIG